MASPSHKKQQIYEAAARLFRDKGFAATSMRDLASEVGLTASSLYNHITSKEEILKEICFRNARRFLKGMDEVETTLAGPEDKVRELLRLHVQVATTDLTSIISFNDEWRHLSEPWLSEFTALRRDYEQRFQAIIRTGMETGVFRPAKTSIVLYTMLSSVRWLYDWYHPDGNISTEELEAQLIDLVMGGLRPD